MLACSHRRARAGRLRGLAETLGFGSRALFSVRALAYVASPSCAKTSHSTGNWPESVASTETAA